MAGFGQGAAGGQPFGEANWSELTVFKSLPLLHRELDTEQYLKKLFLCFEAELDRIRHKIRHLEEENDPLKATVLGTQSIAVTLIGKAGVTEKESPDYGQVFAVQAQAGTPIVNVGIGYVALIGGAEYEVVGLRTRNEPELRNTITFLGGAPEVLLNSTTVDVTLKSASNLYHLAKNFGLIIDENDSPALQRALVLNAVNLYSETGGEKAYKIQADISGFDALVIGLFGIGAVSMSMLPSGKQYEFGGKHYTSIAPKVARFDDLRADVSFVDVETGATETLTSTASGAYMFNDGSSDGRTPAQLYADSIVAGAVSNTSQLSSSQAASYGLVSGYAVTFGVDASFVDNPFANFTKGAFYIRLNSSTVKHYVEAGDYSSYPSLTLITTTKTPLGSGVIGYDPAIETGCGWCKSYKVRLELSPTPQLVLDLKGDGTLVNDAMARLTKKLESIVPIHVKVESTVLALNFSTSLTKTSALSLTIT